MSKMIRCDKCKRMAYEDSRSDKNEMCRITINYIDGFTELHLCKYCHRQFCTEFIRDYTPEEYDDQFGKIE